ncbi:hypothetical protein BDN70DRAFT_806862 [Pholiota conissans]|uniref:Uncharacterized protein n=1 Tax=Pholiota conissans TaxID=109636 RepID=A0A9P5Z1S1_9AGAR|nr:hypothetical protein BDN70DRAFT_806862 [Pholiota conissans]
MGPSTPLASVKKASYKLEKAIKTPSEDSGRTLSAIMKALEDFNTRIIPCFEMAEQHRQEIIKLKADLQTSLDDKQLLETRLKETKVLKKEIARLNHDLTKSNDDREKAIQLAEKAKDEMQNAFSDKERWKTKAQEMETESNNFRKTIERHIIKARTQKAKYEEVVKERNALIEQRRAQESQYTSDSMQVNSSTAREVAQIFERLPQEYEGDWSSHESSRIHSIQQTIMSSPSRSNRRVYPNVDDIQLDCEGMPPPTFGSDWQLQVGTSTRVVQKKRAAPTVAEGSHRRAPTSFAISLDNRGRPTRPVQLGPRTTLQIRR